MANLKDKIRHLPRRKKDRLLGWGMTIIGITSLVLMINTLEYGAPDYWQKIIFISYIIGFYGLSLLIISFLPLNEYVDDDKRQKEKGK